jgi:hypothetical protein
MALHIDVDVQAADCPRSATLPTMMTPTLLAVEGKKAISIKTPYQPHNSYQAAYAARNRCTATLIYVMLALLSDVLSTTFYTYAANLKNDHPWLLLTWCVVSIGVTAMLALLFMLYYRAYKSCRGYAASEGSEKSTPLRALGRKGMGDATIVTERYRSLMRTVGIGSNSDITSHTFAVVESMPAKPPPVLRRIGTYAAAIVYVEYTSLSVPCRPAPPNPPSGAAYSSCRNRSPCQYSDENNQHRRFGGGERAGCEGGKG